MTDILAFAIAAELVTLFYWWLKGGWGGEKYRVVVWVYN